MILFLTKINQTRHFKHENLLNIYENMIYFQLMWMAVTWGRQIFHKLHKPFMKIYFEAFFKVSTL